MNIKKSSIWMLSLVFGVSVILYILDAPIPPAPIPTSVSATILIPTTTQLQPSAVISTKRNLSEIIDYQVRSSPESITVNITLDGIIVTDLQLSQTPGDGESAMYQDAFASEIKSSVVGKNLKDINVSRVAGASYTTDAFMQAIDIMKTKI